MSKFADRFRAHRAAARRVRAINKALAHSGSSPALREEIMTIANRPY